MSRGPPAAAGARGLQNPNKIEIKHSETLVPYQEKHTSGQRTARDRPGGLAPLDGEPRLADPPGLAPLALRVLVGDAEATVRP